jgi:hypothetical protein
VIGHGYRIRFRFARWARSIRLGAIREPLVPAGGSAKVVPTTAARTAPARFVPGIPHSSPGLGAIVHRTAVPTVQGLLFSYALHTLPAPITCMLVPRALERPALAPSGL